ncbi:MAG: hypothetical protein C0478_04420 [Planctomyces sp.]|nr:hypothetical protein [Planctomyces sp.]
MILHHPRHPLSKRPLTRSGFNLLEILLAAALTAVLMAAVTAALNTYYRSTVSSRVELERSRVLRAIQRQIASDLRNVTFTLQEAAAATSTVESATSTATSGTGSSGTSGSGTGGSTGSGSATEGSTTTDTTSTTTSMSIIGADDQLAAGSVGVVGDMATLKLHVSLPRVDVPTEISFDETYAATTSSDLRQVSWYWLAGGGTDPLTGEPSPAGLARYEADRLEASFAETSGKALAMPQVIAPEIASISFRYFDGLTWLESWDSPAMQALPRAVEVTVQFVPAENRLGSMLNTGVAPASNQAIFVIAVPLADPKPAEETL